MVRSLKVAIIGAGPAGLAAAAELARLDFVGYTVYEKADRVKEIGAGISIQRTTWRLLEGLGAAQHLRKSSWFAPEDDHYVKHYNGRTGKLLSTQFQDGIPTNHLHARCQRSMLQNALLAVNDTARIQTSKSLVGVSQLLSGRVRIEFADGFNDEVDLVIGADGIRSVARNHAFPSHRIEYTGRTAYRTLIPTSLVNQIPGLPTGEIVFWHQPKGEWVYTANLGGGVFELTTMTSEPLTETEQKRVSWGEEAGVEQMANHFPDFQKHIQDLFAIAPSVQRYATFAGPRLQTVIVQEGNLALIGDASHPLTGAFGAGAGFALEDAYALAQSLKWAHARSQAFSPSFQTERQLIAAALNLFDQVRSSHYERLYAVLDDFKAVGQALADPNVHLTSDEEVAVGVATNWSKRHNWIYQYDITEDFPRHAVRADAALDLNLVEGMSTAGVARALL